MVTSECDGKLGHRMTAMIAMVVTVYPCISASGLAQQIGGTISPMEPSVAGAAG